MRLPCHTTLLLLGILSTSIYAWSAWDSARRLEILWDEHVDLRIARGLAADPLHGEQPTLDGSQSRLPMYVNALVFRLIGQSDLSTARAASVAAGALTIPLSMALAQLLFGAGTAALAGILLAISPYFLAFSRVAMTEGDVFLACLMTAALYAYLLYLRSPTRARWLCAGLLLGLALGAKLYAAILFPVFLILAKGGNESEHAERDGSAVERHSGGTTNIRRRCWSLFGLALLSFFVLMPVHLLEPDIWREIVRRVVHWDGRWPLSIWDQHLRLYAGILLVKQTPAWGVLAVSAMAYAWIREKDDGRWRPCVLTVALYVLALCFLPLRQSFYLMGVYPLIVVTTSAFVMEIGRWLRELSLRQATCWYGIIALALGHLAYCTYETHPFHHLHGYRWAGQRWLGAGSRGYRNLIQTPSDGVVSLINWCTAHVPPGRRVVSYLWEDAIVRDALTPNPAFHWTPRGIGETATSIPPGPPIDEAEYVLLHINNVLGYGDRVPDIPLEAAFLAEFEPVFTVRRGDLEVAWVFARGPFSP